MFETEDYKAIIKSRAKELKKTRQAFSLRKLAHRIPIQYTYLSKILNDENTHLSEDQCFRAALELGFESTEVDMLLLLRAYQSTKDEDRKQRLKQKIDVLIKSRQTEAEVNSDTSDRLKHEMEFMLDPLCSITKAALNISKYQIHPRLLCVDLGISESRLKTVLKILENNELILTHPEDIFRIVEVKEFRQHFGKNNPLMRSFQTSGKSLIPQRLQAIDEANKQSYLFTLNLDENDFDLVKAEFQAFLKRIESVFKASTGEGVYQLNFDFFKWL